MNSTTPPLRVLVVDDEPAMREVLEARIAQWGYEPRTAESGAQACSAVVGFDPHVILSDLVLPDMTGLELLHQLIPDQRHFILMTAYGNIDTAVQAMKLGAADFLTKPIEHETLKRQLQRVAESRKSTSKPVEEEQPHSLGLGPLIGDSKPQHALFELMKAVAETDATVLITGESGTGKELVARTLHDMSPRKHGPFVAINAAAIPEGLTESVVFGHMRGAFTGAVDARPGVFEQANAGTLFLDEITEMPLGLQAKFLRILEDCRVRRIGGTDETHFDVRVFGATNRDPEQAVAEGLLREDLYYRLNVCAIAVPPLRDRSADIPLLAQHFIERFNAKYKANIRAIHPETIERLKAYHWPGNVRQLRNVVQRAVIIAHCDTILPQHLPPQINVGSPKTITPATHRGSPRSHPGRSGQDIYHGNTSSRRK